jgi:hypothetical protein
MPELHLRAPNGAGESLEASADAIFGLQMQTIKFPVCAVRGDHRLNKAHKRGPEKTVSVGIHFFLYLTEAAVIMNIILAKNVFLLRMRQQK